MRRRKGKDGMVAEWHPLEAIPGSLRQGEDPGQLTRELWVLDELEKALKLLSTGKVVEASVSFGSKQGEAP